MSYKNMHGNLRSRLRRRSVASEERLDVILHALSHHTRRALLSRLGSGPCMVRELAEPFATTRVAISKHIRVLEQARLIRRVIMGRVHQCEICPDPLQEIEDWLSSYRQFWNQKLASLARYVERPKDTRRKSRPGR